jgi:hypothetical protein
MIGVGCVRGGGTGLDPSWFDPMCIEVAARRHPVPHGIPRSFLPVAQVAARHLPAGALVSAIAVFRSSATVPVCSVFSHLSASFSVFSHRRPVGGGLGAPPLPGRPSLGWSLQLPLSR